LCFTIKQKGVDCFIIHKEAMLQNMLLLLEQLNSLPDNESPYPPYLTIMAEREKLVEVLRRSIEAIDTSTKENLELVKRLCWHARREEARLVLPESAVWR
jgi:hypothetical protein